ncbi:hypothetical protein [Streptomyces tendae]|uniref:hypothetical protein n=1 Tax=Streptomyces tendae TaxID=1932 RepID=UPI003692E3F4
MIPLTLLPGRTDTTRIGRDRLELLTALIDAPAFDPLFRDTLIRVPPQHSAGGARSTAAGAPAIWATSSANPITGRGPRFRHAA